MAITIISTPQTDSADNQVASRPVNQRLIYAASSDNYTETNFRFVVNVTSTEGTPPLDESFYISPSPSGEMYLDLHDLLSKKLQYEQSAESVHFSTDFERERHLNLIVVSIKEGYNIGGVFTIIDESEVATDGLFVFWGAYDGATGPYPPISTFDTSATTGISSRLLSDRKPKTIVWNQASTNGLNLNECIFIPVRQNDYGVTYALLAGVSDGEKILYSIVDASGTSHDETLTLNGYRQEVIPCYPANLNSGSLVTNKPSAYTGWRYYSMQLADASENPVSAKYVFFPVEENCDHRNIRVAWRGHRGGWDYYNFQLKNFFTREVSRNRFQRGYSGTSFSGQTRREYERQMKVDRFLDISTNFIDDEEKALLQWLIQSPEVRIIRDNGNSIPVLVETNSFTGIAGADAQPLEQVLIRLKYAGDELNFNGWWVDESEAAEFVPVPPPPNEFKFTIDLALKTDPTNVFEFQLNCASVAGTNNFTIDWGDGSVDTISPVPGNVPYEHTYASVGVYDITITQPFDGFSSIPVQSWIGGFMPVELNPFLSRNWSCITALISINELLSYLDMSETNLASLPIAYPTANDGCINNNYFDLGNCKIPQSDINALLVMLDEFADPTAMGLFESSGQTPAAPPSGAGAAAADNLIAEGWDITTD
jgi:hypothetical protein